MEPPRQGASSSVEHVRLARGQHPALRRPAPHLEGGHGIERAVEPLRHRLATCLVDAGMAFGEILDDHAPQQGPVACAEQLLEAGQIARTQALALPQAPTAHGSLPSVRHGRASPSKRTELGTATGGPAFKGSSP